MQAGRSGSTPPFCLSRTTRSSTSLHPDRAPGSPAADSAGPDVLVPATRYRRCSSTYPRPGSTSRAARTIVSTSWPWRENRPKGPPPARAQRRRQVGARQLHKEPRAVGHERASCAASAPRPRARWRGGQAGLARRGPPRGSTARAASGADALRLLDSPRKAADGSAASRMGRPRPDGSRPRPPPRTPWPRGPGRPGPPSGPGSRAPRSTRPARSEPGPARPPAASRPPPQPGPDGFPAQPLHLCRQVDLAASHRRRIPGRVMRRQHGHAHEPKRPPAALAALPSWPLRPAYGPWPSPHPAPAPRSRPPPRCWGCRAT